MRSVTLLAALLALGCTPSTSARRSDANRQGVLRLAVVGVRAAPSQVERAFAAMEVAAASNPGLDLIRADGRGLSFEATTRGERIDVSALTAHLEADAYLALELEDLRHMFNRVYGPYGEHGYQAVAAARFSARVAVPDGRLAVSRHLDGWAYGPNPFYGPRLTVNDLPEQAIDVAVMRFVEDLDRSQL